MPLTVAGRDKDGRQFTHLREVIMELCIPEGLPGHCDGPTFSEYSALLARFVAEAVRRDFVTKEMGCANGKGVVVICILRAGLALLGSFRTTFPYAEYQFIWTENVVPSNPEIKNVLEYHSDVRDVSGKVVIVLDYVFATGKTFLAAERLLRQKSLTGRPRAVVVAGLFAGERTVRHIAEQHPLYLVSAASSVDGKTGLIQPGPGRAGDRWCGIAPIVKEVRRRATSISCDDHDGRFF